MVRLQTIAYEKIVNIAALGRARVLTTPKKWHTVNPYKANEYISWIFTKSTIIGKLLKPIFDLINRNQMSFNRDQLLQQGLTFEDKFLHHDAEMRRCNLFEHVARQNLHPYHWVLKMRRRQRYFKVQRTCRGFFVPQYVRSQAATQTYVDFQRLKSQWQEFMHENYWSDMTPIPRSSVVPKVIVLELVQNFGILRSEAWNRYFFNEVDKSYFTPKQLEIMNDRKRYPYDLTTSEGKRKFEETITKFNDNHPGIICVEGKKFDFEKHYREIGV